jgi:large subunit GTPase 1
MVCNGVLPIDKLRDFLGPLDLLSERVPKRIFEHLYGLRIEGEKPNATAILTAYAIKHGFYTGNGLPETAKSAKIILKDVVHGRVLYCKLPPKIES